MSDPAINWVHSAAQLVIPATGPTIIPVYLFTHDRMYIDWMAAAGMPTAQDYNVMVAKEGTYLVTDVFEVLGGGHIGNLFVRMYEVPQLLVRSKETIRYIGWGLRSHDREGRHYGMYWTRA